MSKQSKSPAASSAEEQSQSSANPATEPYIRSIQHILQPLHEAMDWAPHLDWAERLKDEQVLRTSSLIRAFRKVKRYDFIPDDLKPLNWANKPLDIGFGQTISQPSTVAQMLEWLKPRAGQQMLEIGSGSGWVTALLGRVATSGGKVFGTERIPELVEMGQDNVARQGLKNVEIKQAGEELGLPDEAPFHRIIVSAHLPAAWLKDVSQQLNPRGGRLVAPLAADGSYGNNAFDKAIVAVTRHGARFYTKALGDGYGFVPIIRQGSESPALRTIS